MFCPKCGAELNGDKCTGCDWVLQYENSDREVPLIIKKEGVSGFNKKYSKIRLDKRFTIIIAVGAFVMFWIVLGIVGNRDSDSYATNERSKLSQEDINSFEGDATSQITLEDKTTSNITTTEAVVILNESCDMILCSGYNGSDYYELVANQTDTFEKSTIEIGVIKNNDWLVPLSSNSPFLTEQGWWKTSEYYEKIEEKFIYLGEGCFLLENSDGISDDFHSFIYSSETGISFNVRGIGAYHKSINDLEINYLEIVNEAQFIAFDLDYNLTYYNLKTGESTKIGGFFEEIDEYNRLKNHSPNTIHGYEDGLFYASYSSNFSTDNSYFAFFNKNGKMIIDLNNYNCYDKGRAKFENGTYEMICYNDNGVKFNITLDTEGNIIKQEKIVE